MTPSLPFPRPVPPRLYAPVLAHVWRRILTAISIPLLEIVQPADPARRARSAASLREFIRNYFPHLAAPNPFQSAFIDELEALILYGPPTPNRKAQAAPRGGGKTTIAQIAILWAGLNRHCRYVFILTANRPKALERITSLKELLITNPLLGEDYPEVCRVLHETRGDHHKHSDPLYPMKVDEFRLLNGVWIAAHGMDSAIAGAVKGDGIRPDFILFDDVCSTIKDAESKEHKTVKRNFQTAEGLPGSDDRTTLLYICTLSNLEDLSSELTDAENNPLWRGSRYSALMKPPTREDLWEAYMGIMRPLERQGRYESLGEEVDAPETVTDADLLAFLQSGPNGHKWTERAFGVLTDAHKRALKFYVANRDAMDAGAEVLSPHVPIWRIYEDRAVNGERYFLCELQNDPPPPEGVKSLAMHILDVRRIVGPTCRDPWNRESQRAPDWAKFLMVSVDTGKNHMYWELDAWDAELQTSIALDAGIADTQVDANEQYRHADQAGKITLLQQAIRSTLRRLYTRFEQGHPNAAGELLPITLAGVDCGGAADNYAWMHDVLQFCATTGRRWLPLKGAVWTETVAARAAGLHFRCLPPKQNPYGRVDVDSDHYKTACLDALEKILWADDNETLPFPGTRQLAAKLDRRYLVHQLAERRNPAGHWESATGTGDGSRIKENHFWDTAYMQFALADLARRLDPTPANPTPQPTQPDSPSPAPNPYLPNRERY